MHCHQRAAMTDFQILRHACPIGNPDASIAALARRVIRVKLARATRIPM